SPLGSGLQLRVAAGNRASGPAAGPRSRRGRARPGLDRREDARAISRRTRRSPSRPDHPHQRRAAPVELSDVAGRLQRTGVRADPLAGLRQGGVGGRDRRICETGTPVRRPRHENRIVSERHAAPASGAGRDLRNLVMRIAAAAVLAPLTVAAAYAGSWLWIALVTVAAIGLYVEWLGIVGTAGEMRGTAAGAVA